MSFLQGSRTKRHRIAFWGALAMSHICAASSSPTFSSQISQGSDQQNQPTIIGDCLPSSSPALSWNCRLDRKGGGNLNRVEECPAGDRVEISNAFRQLADKDNARKSLEQLVRLQLAEVGFRNSIRWFACQGIHVQMDDVTFGNQENPTHSITRLALTILTDKKRHEVWAQEVAKWHDLQVLDDFGLFSLSTLPTQISVQVEFSINGQVSAVDVGVSSK